jgi:tRNA threonylcarbamoyl adenosine modification protein YeaZ
VLILGLDTATPAVTVALHDGVQPLAQLVMVDAHRHAELLTPAISEVIADAGAERADLTGIAVGVGPGPYTGLRVGLVTARVLGAALGVPVYGVCSLDVIAADVETPGAKTPGTKKPDVESVKAPGGFLVATDARRREVYWAAYDERGGRVDGPAVSLPADIEPAGRPVAGEGALLYPASLPNAIGPAYPAAATLCRLATEALKAANASDLNASAAPANGASADDPEAMDPQGRGNTMLLPPEPLYLRRPDAREPGAPKRVSR